MDIAEYARQNNATIRLADSQKGMGWHTDDNGWQYFQQRVTVKMGNRQMTIDWRQGAAYGTALPSAGDVLGSLISDGMAYEGTRSLEDFAADFGYDTTDPAKAREAKKIFGLLERMYPKIVNLFGGKEQWDYVTETIDY